MTDDVGLDVAVPRTLTNQPSNDARPTGLHRRLTVALANADSRVRLREFFAAGAATGESRLVGSEDLSVMASGFASERAPERAELRAQLDAVVAGTMHDCDTARHQMERLVGWRRTLREGAEWATQLQADLPDHLAAVQATRDALDQRRAEQRSAQQVLDRVLEQRAAASAAIDDADRELSEQVGSGMDESGLRRELETAGDSVRSAREAYEAAKERLDSLLAPRPELPGIEGSEWAAIAAVRDALAEVEQATVAAEVDPDALALLEAWTDLQADLEAMGWPDLGPPEADLRQARARVASAVATLTQIEAAASASAITPEQRAELDAAHAAVLLAEDRSGGRWSGSGSRRKVEAAQSAERELLDRYGFAGYLDVVLTGGRARRDESAGAIAQREYFEANAALEAMESVLRGDPEIAHIRGERARLLAQVADLLLVDPGEVVSPLLRSHRLVARPLQMRLAQALAATGVSPIGMALTDAAEALLDAHPLETTVGGPPASEALEAELKAAQVEVDRAAEALQMAEQCVGTFESELTVRAGEDMEGIKRFAAAEQLRSQITAVAGTLRRAEEDARRVHNTASRAAASAATEFEQKATAIGDLARRARKLAGELPIDQRPEGDPLRSLVVLSQSLASHAIVLQPEIDRAEAAVASASVELEDALAERKLAGERDDGPLVEDVVDALQQILADTRGTLLVLDEPFPSLPRLERADLLELVRVASGERPLVLLTEDPDILGWAIELPAEEASALPAEAVLSRLRRDRPERINAGASAPVDIATSTTNQPDPAPTARHRAGLR